MIWAIGEVGGWVRVFMVSDNRDRVVAQLREGEVAFVVESKEKGLIRQVGDGYEVETQAPFGP